VLRVLEGSVEGSQHPGKLSVEERIENKFLQLKEMSVDGVIDVNKASTTKAKAMASYLQGQGHGLKAKVNTMASRSRSKQNQ